MAIEQIQEIAIERITTAPQIRQDFDPEIIRSIAESLRTLGQLQPIRVRVSGDDLIIVDGELRYRAAKLAQLATMKVIVETQALDDGDIIHRQMVANCHRSNLNDLEKAGALDSLMKATGWNATQTAEKLGFSVSAVTKSLALLDLPEAIQQHLRDGVISASAAYALSRVQDQSKQAVLAAQVVGGELTRDNLVNAVKSAKKKPRQHRKPRHVRVTAKLKDRESVSVSADALDLFSFVSILERLLLQAQQARDEGLTLDAMLKRLMPKQEQTQRVA
jgi:ParB family transcriptional regulator, chromosome partitioning protein